MNLAEKNMKKSLLMLIISLFLSFTNAQEIPEQTMIIIDEYLETIPDKSQLAIGLIIDGKHHTLGYKKVEGNIIPIENQYDIYEIGSITKTFTAGLFQQQVANNKMNLNESIYGYLPDFQEYEKSKFQDITFKHLLTHTSGISTSPITIVKPVVKALLMDRKNPNKFVSFHHYEKYFKKYDFEYLPGEKWEYNNGAISLLGKLVEVQETTSWDSLVHWNIFDYLEMNNSFSTGTFVQKENRIESFIANGKSAKYWDMDFINAAGSIKSCSHDMLLWLDAHLKSKKGTWLYNMTENYKVETSLTDNYSGSGWLHRIQNDQHFIWHGGATGGYRAFSAFEKSDNNGIVILINMNARHKDMKTEDNKHQIRINGFKILESLSNKHCEILLD